jgi:hypothetical protein
MKLVRTLFAAALALAPLSIQAGEANVETQAKFLKAIVASTGSTKVACADPALRAALEAVGLQLDSAAPVIWATTMGEAKGSKLTGRLVVSGRRELVSNTCILIEEDGGRPKLLLNTANIRASRVQVSDAILKLAEKI